ncbi:MAG: glycosyltransferase family 2 protein [Mucilaginibacter polytrichastri]|nr:glycosyltransferase family 2 protein [Mucilaginibacter polytrichastri]
MEAHPISVIIPNYNGKNLLEKNLPSVIAALEHSFLSWELIIVDDASADDSVAWLRKFYPQTKLIIHPQNKGFSSACNTGIASAQHELLMLLNSDIVLPVGFFDGSLSAFSDPKTFGVMSRIIGPDGRVQDTARYPRWSGGKMKFSNFYTPEKPGQLIPSIYLSGANALVRTEMIRQLGGFNELLNPFCCEDMDLGIRAWRMGWICFYDDGRSCVHDESSTTRSFFKKNRIKTIYFRNRCLVHYMHLQGGRKLVWALQILFELLFSWLILRFYIYKGIASFIGKIPAADAYRVSQPSWKNICKTSMDEVFKHFDQIRNDSSKTA